MKIPAMMSFWGATNQQVILSSKFSYNVKPDKITVTADNLGMPRRNYVLRWNAPDVSKITVKQELLVEISCNNTLYTAAKLPYSEEILKRFAFSLGKEKNIDPEDKNLEPVCQNIIKKAKRAEEAVELVCDWVNDNIEFTSGTDYGSAETFTTRKGNCNTMSRLACAMVRKIGIPADIVGAEIKAAIFTGVGIQKTVIAFHVHLMKRGNRWPDDYDNQPENNYCHPQFSYPREFKPAFRRGVR